MALNNCLVQFVREKKKRETRSNKTFAAENYIFLYIYKFCFKKYFKFLYIYIYRFL